MASRSTTSNLEASIPSRNTECPRCAYDLRGQVQASKSATPDAFPLRGRCSECGLEFWWVDIFNPHRDKVGGFIEHEPRWLLVAAWKTWWLAACPWVFWQKVRLEMPPRVGRIMLWPVLTVLMVILAAAGVSTILSWQGPFAGTADRWYYATELVTLGIARHTYIGTLGRTGLVWISDSSPALLGPLAATVVIPLVFLCLPHTRRESKVRLAHVARGAIYGAAWLVPYVLAHAAWTIANATYWYFSFQQIAGGGAFPRNRTAGLDAAYAALKRIENEFHACTPWMVVLAVGWLLLWWYFAIRRGWRMNRHIQVLIALLIPALLAALIAVVSTHAGASSFTSGFARLLFKLNMG